MKFGPVATQDARGAILAHAVEAGTRSLRKGQRLAAPDIAALDGAGIAEVIAAVPQERDLTEDAAAEAVARMLRFRGVEVRPAATGRVNIHASAAGVFTVGRSVVDALNAVDPAVTFATLAAFARVAAGQMVATVKIIPFAVPQPVLSRLCEAGRREEAFAVHPFIPRKVGLIQTVLPRTKASVLDKTRRVTGSRLARSGSELSGEARVPHETGATAAAIGGALRSADMVLVFGASAVCDEHDVIPAAIRQAGGIVHRVGMPVDPGNLLVLGEVGGKPVIGAPGCARSPKENGFDWVLDRFAAGLPVSDADIAGMGVGGLLMEIPTRPQPRDARRASRPEGGVHAVLLAAGRSSRMGGPNKLLAQFGGKALVREVAERVGASRIAGTVVVTGHQGERVAATLADLPVRLVSNVDFASGLASSLKAGIAALPADAAGALIVLGDMPGVTAADLDRLIETFEAAGGGICVRATAGGRRGNPVILPRQLFSQVATLEGDTGARHLVEAGPVIDVELGERAAVDVDTPEAMSRAGGVFEE